MTLKVTDTQYGRLS